MLFFARVAQETNTFNPKPTELEHFQCHCPLAGEKMLAHPMKNRIVGGVAEGLKECGLLDDLKPVMYAGACPAGRVSTTALRHLRDALVKELHGMKDGDTLFLALHGAWASEDSDSADSLILDAVRREVGRNVFLVLILDHHANVTREMMTHPDLMIGFETLPHDFSGAGRKAVRVWRRVMREKIRPATAWRKIPMTAPMDNLLTDTPGPMKAWFDHARQWEKDSRVLAVSPFPMQPWLDVEQGGWAVVVQTAGDQELAEKIADESAEFVWQDREAFWARKGIPPAEAVRVPGPDAPGLTVILDMGDMVLGGSPGDSTVLLREIVEQRIEAPIYLPLVDSDALDKAYQAGLGKRLKLRLGGHIGTEFYAPLEADCLVRAVSNRSERAKAPSRRAALLDVHGAQVAVIDAPGWCMMSPDLYTDLGLRMEDAAGVVAKTGGDFRSFGDLQKRVVYADTAGATQSRLQGLTWTRLPRPIFPFDPIQEWR